MNTRANPYLSRLIPAFNPFRMFGRPFANVWFDPEEAGAAAVGAAAGAEAGDQTGAEANPQTSAGTPDPEQTYTLAQVQALIQSETDKRITQAQKKWQKEHQRALALAGMSDDARAAAQKDDEIADLKQRLAEANQYKARTGVITKLSEKGLPAALADVIAIEPEDEEMNAARVNALEAAIRQAVEAEVKKRLAGKTPAAPSGAQMAMTREQYARLSLNEKQALAHRSVLQRHPGRAEGRIAPAAKGCGIVSAPRYPSP